MVSVSPFGCLVGLSNNILSCTLALGSCGGVGATDGSDGDSNGNGGLHNVDCSTRMRIGEHNEIIMMNSMTIKWVEDVGGC